MRPIPDFAIVREAEHVIATRRKLSYGCTRFISRAGGGRIARREEKLLHLDVTHFSV